MIFRVTVLLLLPLWFVGESLVEGARLCGARKRRKHSSRGPGR